MEVTPSIPLILRGRCEALLGFHKSATFVGEFDLVQHDPKGSHHKIANQGRGILYKIMKKGSGDSGMI